MIDEKKIEEAIREVYDSNAIFRKYDQVEIAFKAGIDWLLDNLKHPMSESPKMGDLVLIVRNIEQYELRHENRNVNPAFTHELDFHDNWETMYAKNPEYEYWINVNEIIDLLKKKI